MRALVTGSAAHLGEGLVRTLRERGHTSPAWTWSLPRVTVSKRSGVLAIRGGGAAIHSGLPNVQATILADHRPSTIDQRLK